jgi:DNA-binding NarL/FixJ family response regulator
MTRVLAHQVHSGRCRCTPAAASAKTSTDECARPAWRIGARELAGLTPSDLTRAALRPRGREAGFVKAALAEVQTTPPRLIVLDLMLPELNGVSVMRQLRERSTVSVVMLCARGTAADRDCRPRIQAMR